ncbi:hypothetical protein D3C75_1371870 [compost metagenome]
MQTIGPATTLHGTTGMFVDNNNFAIFDDVINITGKQHVRTQSGGHVVHKHNVGRGVE